MCHQLVTRHFDSVWPSASKATLKKLHRVRDLVKEESPAILGDIPDVFRLGPYDDVSDPSTPEPSSVGLFLDDCSSSGGYRAM